MRERDLHGRDLHLIRADAAACRSGEEEGRRFAARFVHPGAVDANFFWLFSMSEEWRDREPDDVYPSELLANADSRARTRREAEHRVDFARWRFALSAFCDRIFVRLRRGPAYSPTITSREMEPPPIGRSLCSRRSCAPR